MTPRDVIEALKPATASTRLLRDLDRPTDFATSWCAPYPHYARSDHMPLALSDGQLAVVMTAARA
jgi:hypothetical protein